MDEMNSILPPDLVSSLDQYYTARQPDAAFSSHLAAQLRHRQIELLSPNQKPYTSHSSTRSIFMQKLRTRPIRAVLLSILALLALTGVAYAIGRLTGFIPGFGFTSESNSVFVLAEPVEMTSGGIMLHVDQAVNDGEQFWALSLIHI